jgi:hypothetical protein
VSGGRRSGVTALAASMLVTQAAQAILGGRLCATHRMGIRRSDFDGGRCGNDGNLSLIRRSLEPKLARGYRLQEPSIPGGGSGRHRQRDSPAPPSHQHLHCTLEPHPPSRVRRRKSRAGKEAHHEKAETMRSVAKVSPPCSAPSACARDGEMVRGSEEECGGGRMAAMGTTRHLSGN